LSGVKEKCREISKNMDAAIQNMQVSKESKYI
jgi:hypothetical protein